jgi:hypothetical protein
MTRDDVKRALIEVLDRVQATSGLPTKTLSGSDIPARVLERFDSTVWPAATGWLAKALKVEIPNEVHVFGTLDGKTVLTIDESVDLVLRKHKGKQPVMVAAE